MTEDLSTLGTPINWSDLRPGDEVVAHCNLRQRWVIGRYVSDLGDMHYVKEEREGMIYTNDEPVRLIRRAGDPTAAIHPEDPIPSTMSLAGCDVAEERHTLALAIREVLGLSDDEPDGDLAARLREWADRKEAATVALRGEIDSLHRKLTEVRRERDAYIQRHRAARLLATPEEAAILDRIAAKVPRLGGAE
jgi:hypothetical protein